MLERNKIRLSQIDILCKVTYLDVAIVSEFGVIENCLKDSQRTTRKPLELIIN
jgi:hypothetical protein